MAILDMSAMNAALKELYDGQVVEDLVYSDNPTLAMLPKKTDFGGKYKPVPVIIGVSQGRSSTFANALANQSAVDVESFLITRKSDYSIAEISNETMLASATDKMAFLEGSKLFIDGAIRSATLSLSSSIFRSGTGSIGQVGSIAVGVITLANRAEVVQFEKNQTLNACATDGGAARAAVGYVVAVNRSAGTITVAASMGGAPASPALWVAGDYLVVEGDLNAKMSGFAAWIPDADPSATPFFGVDRSTDTVRLGGNRYDGSSQSIEEALIDASSQIAENGGKPGVGIVTYASFSALEKSLGSKVQYVDAKGPANVGFRGIMINGASSTIKIFPDRNQRAQKAHLLQMDTWALNSLGDAPMILKYGDNLDMLRVYNGDSSQVRVGYYAQLATNAPGWNGVVSLSA